MNLPQHVTLVEVGPRDGLQNEKTTVPTDIKIRLIELLTDSGLSIIEATSFVSPKWIPQLADGAEVLKKLKTTPTCQYPVLVPNVKGFEAAVAADAKIIAVFTAASETFSQNNTNSSIEESLTRIQDVIHLAKKHHIAVRGYVSCVLGCPFQGSIDADMVALVAERLFNLGCYEISLGDTIGVGTPKQTQLLIEKVAKKIPREKIAVHFHDTYGQALTNIYAALEKGISVIDSSVSGLGGCPYARGATGNVATEDVLYLLNGLGIKTGVDLQKLVLAGQFINAFLQRESNSKVAKAIIAKENY